MKKEKEGEKEAWEDLADMEASQENFASKMRSFTTETSRYG